MSASKLAKASCLIISGDRSWVFPAEQAVLLRRSRDYLLCPARPLLSAAVISRVTTAARCCIGSCRSVGEIALDVLCRDGKALPVLFSAAAKKDDSGAVILFRVVVLNAPTRREYERELLRARFQAEEAAEMLRIHRELAERKVADQDTLLQAVSRMAAGNLDAPVPIEAGSTLAPLAAGLDRMRKDILRQIQELKERNAEVQQLNRELRHQIERRSGLLVESMLSRIDDDTVEVLPVLSPGTLLARRYRIGTMLGQGAMGVVYEVERISDGRRLAAKILSVKPDYQAMARFAREAQLLARLQHPNLIAIVDADVTQDRVAYIIMELASGKSLAEFTTATATATSCCPYYMKSPMPWQPYTRPA